MKPAAFVCQILRWNQVVRPIQAIEEPAAQT